MKYCRDCAHFLPASEHIGKSAISFGRCLKTRRIGTEGLEYLAPNMESEIKYEYASCIRANTAQCGPDASWFEPKDDAERERWAEVDQELRNEGANERYRGNVGEP